MDCSGAFHIDSSGTPIYAHRFLQSFGFYQGLAAVQTKEGWTHVDSAGHVAYTARYEWVGNFQEGHCVAEDFDHRFFHIDPLGRPAYFTRYRYVGDFRDGVAVATLGRGRFAHIRHDGSRLNRRTFRDLAGPHKGVAEARDYRGWYHVDRFGRELYSARFTAIEPFYNGRARALLSSGSRVLIDEQGKVILRL
jgi:hypothetical protein